MSRKKMILTGVTGILIGAAISNPAAHAGVIAERSSQPVYVDGKQVQLEAYAIHGNNYVKLRDIGEAVGFNVYWNGAVQIDSDAPYTGTNPTAQQTGTVTLPTDGSRYVPKAGDRIRCDDGTTYTITDVSRWDKNAFASGAVGALPTPTCDWSSFPEIPLPQAEVRHFKLEAGDYLFIRNLYETRRMQYTLMNLAGNHPDTSENGRLKYGSKGTPLVRISLTIDNDLSPYMFWPWRESEIANLFQSRPIGSCSMECWDVYKDGVFQRTEYNICTR